MWKDLQFHDWYKRGQLDSKSEEYKKKEHAEAKALWGK